MKKIAILTFHNACNYGAFLQAKALLEFIGAKDNVEAYIIDYKNKNIIEDYSIKSIFSLKQNLRTTFLKMLRIIDILKRNKIFEQYQKETFNMIKIDEINNLKIDKVIVGSDQVWNFELTDYDMNYFLPFVKSECRVSYSASAGSIKEDDETKKIYEKYLNEFNAISVREKELANLINTLEINKKAITCLDPVFLKTKAEWETYACLENKSSSKYILVFIMGVSKQADKIVDAAVKCANENNLHILILGDQERWYKYRHIKHYGVASPREFIRLIAETTCVFTNSFHATAFSIILNKAFYTEMNISNNERIQALLDIVGLESRIMKNGKMEYLYTTDIDWKRVNNKLEIAIMKSKEFLEKSIQ